MGTKSFFNKQKSQETKVRGQEKSTIDAIGQNVESVDYIKEYTTDKFDFVPQLDFEEPANFVKYGSAKDYYVDLVDSVVQSYPYDGSLAEKLKYRNGLVAIQKHEFDKNYPRSVGYADFSDESYAGSIPSTFTIGALTFGLGESSIEHYILTDNYSNKLIYNTGSNQVGSIELDFSTGATVEFWMKKDAFPDAGETQNEVIFSVSNEEEDLFQVVTDVTSSGNTKLYATFSKTITSAEFVFELNTNISGAAGNGIADGDWHHYALAFSTSSTGYVGEIYVDGHFQEKKFYTNGSPKLVLTGTLDATVGASSLSSRLGDGGLLGSIDEVRLWKVTRDAKQIGINYFFDTGGGGNTDTTKVSDDDPLGLSLYYKFNEGNTGTSSIDSVVLDYSGRLTDGVWVGYNTSGHVSRATGSAIIESGVTTEVGSPIIYSTHSEVAAYKADKITSGSAYDAENLGSMYSMLPQFISDDDAANGLLIRKMVQIMSSYLDTLHAQITAISQLQDGTYVSGSNAKPNPFSKRNLVSYGFDIPDVFIDPGVIEEIYFKDEKRLYEEKLFNLKNLIFQNIFNNLNYINKSKGTEKSFRNLFRCFGVDNELVRLNMYSDNQEYEIKENYEASQAKRNVVDLSGYNDGQNREVVLYTFADPLKSTAATGDFGYVPSSSNAYIPLTFEAQFQFPKFVNFPNGYLDNLVTASLFGVHSASGDTAKTTIGVDDQNFKVYANTNTNKKTQFILTTNIGSVGTLTSSFYEDVYDNTNWTFAVRSKPREYPYAETITSSNVFDLEFYGVNYVAGYKLNEFSASAEVNLADIGQFITGSNKRLYVGADRTNITGTLNHKANTRIVSSRVWFDYLTNQELQNHTRDVNVFGRLNPYRNSFIYENGESGSYVPRINTLALNWNFENITGSDSSGKFLIQDTTSGSSYTVDSRFTGGEYSRYVGPNYSGQGSQAAANSTDVVDFLFVDTAEQQLPENLYSSDLVEIREGDDTLFTRESRPSKYYFAVETSLYDTISREMLGFFASIKDFNSLIGNPVNMYRPNYKGLEKLREIFFENIQNEPDLDKYVNLYKWLDGALDSVISNLIPASARTSDKVRNIVESHILERSKYRHKYLAFKEYTKEERISKQLDTLPNDITVSRKIEVPYGIDVGNPITNVAISSKQIPYGLVKDNNKSNKQGLRPKSSESNIPIRVSDITRATSDPITLSITRQDISPVWYRTKVERGVGQFLATNNSSVDDVRIQTKINQSQVATGSSVPPFIFNADATRTIGTNEGFSGENRKNYFPNSFNISSGTVSEDGIVIHIKNDQANIYGKPYYDYSNALDKTYGGNRRTPLTVTDQVSGKSLLGQNYLPFDVLSASTVVSDYQQDLFDVGLEVAIATKHGDYIGVGGSILQSPFTEENVGGYMYRHGNLLETDPLVRKEGYQFNIVEGTPSVIYINNPRMVSGSTPEPQFTKDRPLGFWIRDVAAKRPINIRNISGSNYFNQYEVIQTTGRRENNRYYVKSSGFTGSVTDSSSLGGDEKAIFFFKEFEILDRENTGSNEFVIVNRFSAPGGKEVNSFAYLDIESAEYSVYNSLNYRNLVDRLDNHKLLTRHTLTGGFDSVDLQPSGAFYKPQRNGIYKISASLETPEPIFDNSYVNFNIPRTDVQYRWIASSWIARKTGYPNDVTLNSTSGLLTGANINPGFHQNVSDFDYDISSSDYSPIYGRQFSENIRFMPEGHMEYNVGSATPVSVAFNGVNYVIVGNVDLDQNLFTTASTNAGNYYNLPEFAVATAPYILNALLLSNNGPYQHPTFKQIRHGEHRVGREFARRNIYRNQLDVMSDDRERMIRAGNQVSITQSPVTNKYKPVVQFIDEQTGTIEYEFGNKLEYFASTYVSSSNEIKDFNLEMGTPNRNILETDFYKFSSKYNLIRYNEVVYPKRETQYRDIARNRENYVSFWKSDTLSERTDATIVNSQGATINASKWLMDVSLSGSSLGYQAEKSGELMRFTGSSGLTSSVESEKNARYSFNLGECRPDNLVQSQAGTGAFYNSYGKFSTDTRLIGQDETIIPEFTISDYVSDVILNFGGDFSEKSVYSFTLTGSQSIAGNNFAEIYGKTEKIGYLEELKGFYGEPSAIRLSFDTTKKLLPREGFYPVQRTTQLAGQLSSSYSGSTINTSIADVASLAPGGDQKTTDTTLLPFWAPGIGYNSIKAGFAVEFPYKSEAGPLTASETVGFDSTAPFEAILAPSEFVSNICHIQNSSSAGYTSAFDSTGSTNRTDGIYELMSHNFFAEVPEFFLEDLSLFKSSPEQAWEFEGPLSSSAGVKRFMMNIVIENPAEFIQYGGAQSYGPFPQNNHAPPGMYFGDGTQNPCPAWNNVHGDNGPRGANTTATLIFDPTDLISTTSRVGRATFTLKEIVANSTILHEHSNATAFGFSVFMSNTASLDLFNLDGDSRWTIKSKWECPVLNFSGTAATGGGSPVSAPATYTRGMWHQYGSIDNGGARRKLHVRLDQTNIINPALTGSLLDAVGFKSEARAFGRIKGRKVIEEAICAIPYYVDCSNNEEKFFEIPIDFFENRYGQVRKGQTTDDSISDMIRKMDKYVVPPIYDFVAQRDISRSVLTTKKEYEPISPPISMYFFEFSSELSQQDLANIWQGVMPEIATKAEKERVVLEHPIADGELLSPTIFRYNGLSSIPNDIRWKIFKVKKRAAKDYYEMVQKLTGVKTYKRSEAGRYSFNWPYDYFSLVELGKMDVEFEVQNKTPNRIKDLKGDGFITPEQAIETAISFGQPIEIGVERPEETPVDRPTCTDEAARELQLLINKSQTQTSALGGPIGGVLTAREISRLQLLLAKCPRPEPTTPTLPLLDIGSVTDFDRALEEEEEVPQRLCDDRSALNYLEPGPCKFPEPEFTSPITTATDERAIETTVSSAVTSDASVLTTGGLEDLEEGFDPDSPDPGSVEAGDPELCTDEELAELAALIEDSNMMGDEFPLDLQRRLTELLEKC